MRINCNPFYKEKNTNWHKWFAWYPVNPINTWDILFLETIERVWVESCGPWHFGNWDYRRLIKKRKPKK
jgi:hypothetical protein